MTNLHSVKGSRSGDDKEILPLVKDPSQTERSRGDGKSCGLGFLLSEFLDPVDDPQVEIEGVALVAGVTCKTETVRTIALGTRTKNSHSV